MPATDPAPAGLFEGVYDIGSAMAPVSARPQLPAGRDGPQKARQQYRVKRIPRSEYAQPVSSPHSNRSDCYRLEQQLPDGFRARKETAPFHGARKLPLDLDSLKVFHRPEDDHLAGPTDRGLKSLAWFRTHRELQAVGAKRRIAGTRSVLRQAQSRVPARVRAASSDSAESESRSACSVRPQDSR